MEDDEKTREEERKTTFSEASELYKTWDTNWSKPQELDDAIIGTISECMSEPSEEDFLQKWQEMTMGVESSSNVRQAWMKA
ncbi:hypothetical protein IAR50_007365 [Cryptococcus sp. DSM 104548]